MGLPDRVRFYLLLPKRYGSETVVKFFYGFFVLLFVVRTPYFRKMPLKNLFLLVNVMAISGRSDCYDQGINSKKGAYVSEDSSLR